MGYTVTPPGPRRGSGGQAARTRDPAAALLRPRPRFASRRVPVTYMTSTGRLFVPSTFNFCSFKVHINGRGQAWSCLPRCGRGRVRGTLSLGTEEAQAPSGSRPGRRPLAAPVLAVSAAVLALGGLSPADVSKYPNLVSISQASATLAQDLRAFLSWAIS